MRKVFKKIVTVVVVFAILICSFSTSYANETSVSKQPTTNQELGLSSSSSNDTSGYIPTPVYNDNPDAKVSANQTRNIRCLFYATESFTGMGSFTVFYTSPLSFHLFIPNDTYQILLGNYTSSQIIVTYNMDNSCSAGDFLLELRFNLPGSQTTIPSITTSTDSKVECYSYLLGDVDGDNNITSSDALLVNQASTNSITLTQQQQIKADADGSGAIGSADTLLIMQYSTNKVLSFWGIDSVVNLPSSENTTVTDTDVYRIKSTLGEYYWTSYPTNPTLVRQMQAVNSSKHQEFIFNYKGDGEYNIHPYCDMTKYVYVNSDKQIKIGTPSDSNSALWYLAPNSGSYFIINKSFLGDFITSNSVSDGYNLYCTKNIKGGKWTIEEDNTITVNTYYDNAFHYKFDWANQSGSRLVDINNTVHDIFDEFFGVNIKFNAPVLYNSLADRCKDLRGIDVSDDVSSYLNDVCSLQPQEEEHTHGVYSNVPSGTTVYYGCTDNPVFRQAFYDEIDASKLSKSVLWSGHKLVKYQLKGQTWDKYDENRSCAGSNYITMISGSYVKRLPNSTYANCPTAVLAHEIAHLCGARDHYHEERAIIINGEITGYTCYSCAAGICSAPDPDYFNIVDGEESRDDYCLMNTTAQQLSSFATMSPLAKSLIFCDYCEAEIQEFINNNY